MSTLRKCYAALSATQDWKVDLLACFGFLFAAMNLAILILLLGYDQ